MSKFLIADFVTELSPKFEQLNNKLADFAYFGDKSADITLSVSDDYICDLQSRMSNNSTIQQAEEFAYTNAFNKAVINHNAMLVHSSAIVYDGLAYLFSADSGVGKSTHTRLWMQAFGDKVKILNDDKPVVRIYDDKCVAFGTPFDGGSGIYANASAPLKAIVFIERGEENIIRKANSSEIIRNLYLSTVKIVDEQTASAMLSNFDKLISLCDFYVMRCNMDISAAHTAFDALIN